MDKFKDKVALITGGTKGIGRGIAEALLELGMNVAITSRNLTSAEKVAAELSKGGKGKAIGVKADVRKMDSQVQAVDTVLKEFGKLDVLVANAGLGHFAGISDMTADEWQETIDTNLTGVFFSVKAALNELKKSKGYIFTISSLAGTNFFAGGAAYNASKFGVTGFTQAIMLDLRQDDVKVSTIMPGSVATHFNGNEPSKKDAWKIQSEDIGELVVDLLKMNPRTLPSKIEVRPSKPPQK
ncbi:MULTISPECIES: SDR family oxidoreductase [unclassified Leeuwenhoekiella]|uniref:SDR family oxidoreductase n=1 Tax=unclassified Leeuwenhoekiella TaxID=2615029 RepID=UPI000C3C31AD|nr:MULTISPECIES: SDR family oxidoreductase [unclassified Leeuwenhoekiella]MAW95021.1 short-chain dehydrogenase [Leeuwenhoekiella sp.]MBA79741.1 short-chain dehydrogenase [Leeuwenhoekiella sp.]|tara:strand:+ start:31505 stop:32224 length:720 start_codon:yes stop_codon:yes gene_type:complete